MVEENVISIIAAMDEKGGIGKQGQLPFHLPRDMQYFKSCTWAHPVIVGRTTFQSFKNYLPARCNIVLTRKKNHSDLPMPCAPFLYMVSSIQEALQQAKKWHTKEIFIIGGAEVYAQVLPLAHQLYITRVAQIFPDADTFFPEINKNEWVLKHCTSYEKDERNPCGMAFEKWTRNP